jgi:hypothetical protein
MSRVVRDPENAAIASIGGENETYMVVPVAHDRSAAWAAPMIATGCAMRERTRRARAYRSASSLVSRFPVTSSLRLLAMVLPSFFAKAYVG